MIAKKNPKADLEKKRFAFFQIGLLVAGSLCLAAFEYSSAYTETASITPLTEGGYTVIDEDPPYEYEEQPVKQQPKARVIDLSNEVNVVDKDIKETNTIVTDKNDHIVIEDGDGDVEEYGFSIAAPAKREIIDVPDVEPQFPGGEKAMAEWIQDEIELPDYIPAYEKGTVYVRFVVNEDGSIEQVSSLRGPSEELNKSAVKVVRKMPKWIPGEQAGKPVRVRFTLPIRIG